MRKLATFATACAMALTSAVGLAGNASAADRNVAYNGACGSGYSVVNSGDMQYGLGTVYLTYSASTGKNCVVAIQTEQKYASKMMAEVRRTGSSTWIRDSGEYRYYAGPVYVSAAGHCVDWGGSYLDGGAYFYANATNCG
ncbi:spore-associated protein A [Streptomyces sp. MMCC 100]|uniref:spore-associated protein A n=1 Tax=Streptomyces sp. MMCC 100 TaxID=3163555 RepID=UPI00359B6BDD